MAQYPQNSFDAMRQDAIRRSREMHRRAMPQMHPAPPEPEQLPPPPVSAPPPKPKPSKIPEGFRIPEELQGLLTDWDSEKLLLAGFLYLLWKEGADPALLLALGYIML